MTLKQSIKDFKKFIKTDFDDIVLGDVIRLFSTLGILIAGPGYFIYAIVAKLSPNPENNSNIETGLLLTFIASTSLYILPMSHKLELYFKNDKVEEILEKVSHLEETNELFNLYVNITKPPEFVEYKEKLMQNIKREFKSLYSEKSTGKLTIKDGHTWSMEVLENLEKTDYVKAVSLLNSKRGEWRNDLVTSWHRYEEANEKAASKCSVQRVFIAYDEVLKEHLNDEKFNFIKKHLPNNGSNLNGFFVNRKNFDRKYPELRDDLMEGFLLIKKDNLKMAVIDKFSDVDDDETMYKMIITYNINKIEKMEKAFDKVLKKYFTDNDIKIDLDNLIGNKTVSQVVLNDGEIFSFKIIEKDNDIIKEILAIDLDAFGEKQLNCWSLVPYIRYGYVFGLFKENVLQGFAIFIRNCNEPKFAYLVEIAVAKNSQNKGCGYQLLLRSLTELREKGITAVTLTVDPNNLHAMRMYTKLGFEVAENNRKGEYGEGKDRKYLRLELKNLN